MDGKAATASFGGDTGRTEPTCATTSGRGVWPGSACPVAGNVEWPGTINRATEAVSTNNAAASSRRRGQIRARGVMAMTLLGVVAPRSCSYSAPRAAVSLADFMQGGACFRGTFEDVLDGRAFGGIGQLTERVGGQPGVLRIERKGFGVHGIEKSQGLTATYCPASAACCSRMALRPRWMRKPTLLTLSWVISLISR